MREAFRNYINGRWTEPKSGNWLDRENPADYADAVCSFPDSSRQDVANAVGAAAEAFESWRFVPAPRRAEVLFRAAEIMAGRGLSMVPGMQGVGHALLEAGDLSRTLDIFKQMSAGAQGMSGAFGGLLATLGPITAVVGALAIAMALLNEAGKQDEIRIKGQIEAMKQFFAEIDKSNGRITQ